MLDFENLEVLSEELSERLKYDLPRILIHMNRNETLEKWLELMGLDELLPMDAAKYEPFTTGKIVIVGDGAVKEKHVKGIAKQLGLDSCRLECCLDYSKTIKYNYKKLQYNPNYSLVLVGPVPHSTEGKGSFGSVIAAMEQTEGYPPVIRLGENELKITKSNIQKALVEAIQNELIKL